MEKGTERELYEGRPEEVNKQVTGQVSDGVKPIWSLLPLSSTLSAFLLEQRGASCRFILLFSLNCEALRIEPYLCSTADDPRGGAWV